MSSRNSKRNKPPFPLWLNVTLIVAAIAIAGVISYFGWDPVSEFLGLSESAPTSHPAEGEVQVHYIDVGQGDCALILTPEKAVLIDSGDVDYPDKVIQYLNKLKIKKLDLIIATHAHADHIGGMDKIIETFEVGKLLIPELPAALVPNTKVFTRMLLACDENDVERGYARVGDNFDLGNSQLQILAPHEDFTIADINNSSIVAKLIHGDNKFLFTGDMEKAAENDLLARKSDISANVLKVAHHGSASSSQRKFLDAVGGEHAVISVGSPNSYNHPNEKTLENLQTAGYQIARTDESGTIVFISSKSGFEIKKENE
jgi:competence protein ComEC